MDLSRSTIPLRIIGRLLSWIDRDVVIYLHFPRSDTHRIWHDGGMPQYSIGEIIQPHVMDFTNTQPARAEDE